MPIFDRSELNILSAKWGRAFAVAFVFVVFASALTWLDTFRGYQSEVRVLVIMRAGQSAESADQTIGNIAELPKNLSFYERVLADNDFLEDRFAGRTPDERKARWNESVSVTRSDGSGTLVIRARADTNEDARLLSEQTAKALFGVAGRYYDVKTDIDMRMVDGPVTEAVIVSPVLYVLTSLLSGLVVTGLFFMLLSLIERFSLRLPKKAGIEETFVPHEEAPKKTYGGYALGESVPYIDPRTFVPKKPTSLIPSFETSGTVASQRMQSEIKPQAKPVGKKTESSGVAKASAPANLPIADEEVVFPFASGVTEIIEEPAALEKEPKEKQLPVAFGNERIVPAEEKPSEEPDSASEPTIEEYKRRLNELLAGGK